MFESIWDDIKYQFNKGTRLNQIILINGITFVVLLFVRIGFNMTQGVGSMGFHSFTESLALHTDASYLLRHPWVVITHMFMHLGFWHIFWNMIMLVWFGNIVGDLIGDRYIWSIYFFSGLTGALSIFIFSRAFHYPSAEVLAYGASAAVMGFVLAATILAPDYIMHLLLIGAVRLKYVALGVILLDLAGLAENTNTGGHIGHLGGAFGGALFIWALRSESFSIFWSSLIEKKTQEKGKIITMDPTVKTTTTSSPSHKKTSSTTLSTHLEEVDKILDKIRNEGIQSLTPAEKKILDDQGKL